MRRTLACSLLFLMTFVAMPAMGQFAPSTSDAVWDNLRMTYSSGSKNLPNNYRGVFAAVDEERFSLGMDPYKAFRTGNHLYPLSGNWKLGITRDPFARTAGFNYDLGGRMFFQIGAYRDSLTGITNYGIHWRMPLNTALQFK